MNPESKTEFFSKSGTNAWLEALSLLENYQRSPSKADLLLERLPDRISGVERRRLQALFMSAVRHALWIDKALAVWMKRKPQPRLRAILHLACGEFFLREAGERAAVVDYAVDRARELCSKAESGMVNAVLRKVVASMSESGQKALPMFVRYSHPKWLVERWLQTHDVETVRAWLEWNQRAPEVFVRLFGESEGALPKEFCETEWTGFVRVSGEHWRQVEQIVNAGFAYIQDPSTRHPVGLLAPRSGENVLDLCAAPGGKSVSISRALGYDGKLVAVDLPGRVQRLRENLSRTGFANYTVVECDVFALRKESQRLGLPEVYSAVLLDAPCSNTGVLRRRPDAKWRLQAHDISQMAEIQFKLLCEAGGYVKSGGRLVYSTCSVEPEENAQIAERFMAIADGAWTMGKMLNYYPHSDHHDGGGAVCFVKK